LQVKILEKQLVLERGKAAEGAGMSSSGSLAR
jgi:hypothetical protein